MIHATEEKEGDTRIVLSLPIEKDFLQPHVLLLPKNQGSGPFPAVIAWTSTSPDYTQPEAWWGRWLAQRGKTATQTIAMDGKKSVTMMP